MADEAKLTHSANHEWIDPRMLSDCRATPSEPAITSASTIWTRDESSELLRLAIQVGGIGIFDADLERKRIRFSPELCAILGLPAGTEMDCCRFIRK